VAWQSILSGNFGTYVPALKHHLRVHEIIDYDLRGNELDRVDAVNMGAIPIEFRGRVSLAVWYGFLGRYGPRPKPLRAF
jgi:hypothetical protein